MGWLPASLFCSLVLSFTRRPCGPGHEPCPQKVCAVQSQEFCDESAHMFFAVVLALALLERGIASLSIAFHIRIHISTRIA